MGLFDSLFGSGGSSGSPSKIVDVTPDQFVGLRGPVANILKQFLTGSAPPSQTGVPSPSGPTTAQLQPLEQQILQLIGGQATGGGLDPAKGLVNKTLGGSFLSPASNPFLQQTIEAATRPVRQTFEDTILPQLRSAFTAQGGQMIQGQGSSPFAQAQNRAFRDLETTVGDISSNIAFSNFQQERGRQQEAVGQALQLSSGEIDNMVKSLQASALPRMIEQHGLDKGIELFNSRVQTLMEALRLALGASSPQAAVLPGTSGTADTTGDILGGLGSLGLGAAALFSDARLKTDIHKIGKLTSGPGVYTYRYKGSDEPRIGVMAQEVEKILPDAVGDVGGIKFVDTSKL